MRLLLVLLFASLLGLAACDSSSTANDAFTFAAFDADERLVLEGTLDLVFEEAGAGHEEITGTWSLQGRNGYPTPQPASGSVDGEAHGDALEFRLSQNVSDAGFLLEGTRTGDRITGTWSTITITGPVPQGTFEAVRE